MEAKRSVTPTHHVPQRRFDRASAINPTLFAQAYTTDDAPISPEEEKALLWKQDKRIVPLSAAIYFLCYLDRSNIGNAKILNASSNHDLMSETGMSNYQYTIALMIFLVAYGLFEVPSNGSYI